MSGALEMAGFLEPLRGVPRTLRLLPRGAELRLRPGEACVCEGPAPRAARAREFRVQSYCVLPGTGGGWVLLAEGRPAVFRAGTSLLPRGRAISRLASGFVRESSRLLLHRLAPRRLALVERGDDPIGQLERRFEGLEQDLAWNVASGVPGRDQKTIVQFVQASGSVRAYAKIAHGPAARALVEHEASVLARLSGLGLPAPRLFGLESRAQTSMLVQGALAGTRSRGELGPAHARYLARLEQRTRRDLPLSEIPSQRLALERLEALAGRAEREWLETFQALARELAAAAGSAPVPCALAHGDFTPWNVLVDGDSAQAFDWEHARLLAPRGHDALHFTLQQAVLVDHVEPAKLEARLRERCAEWLGERPFVALAAYLLDIASADEALQLEQRSPFAQVDWLRRARLALARGLLAVAPSHGGRA